MRERAGGMSWGDLLSKIAERGSLSAEHEEAIASHLGRVADERHEGLGGASARALAGIGAWIAALCFLGFVELTEIVSEASGRMFFGLILIGGAAVLQRREAGPFLAQLGVALGLAGKMAVAVSLGILEESLGASVLVSFALWLFTYPFLPRAADRFLTTVGTLGLTLIWLIAEDHLFWIRPLIMGSLVVAIVAFSRRHLPPVIRPMAYGLVAAAPVLLMMELLPSAAFPRFVSGPDSATHWIFKLVFTAVAVYVVAWASDFERTAFERPRVLAVGAAVVLGLLTTPGILAALALLVLGFGRAERTLTALGFVFLVVFLASWYYNLDATLLQKSIALMLSGVVLLAARMGLRHSVGDSEPAR